MINPTGKLRLGRTLRRFRPHRPQNYCGHPTAASAATAAGAFSGKDPSKVDRSAAYYARYAAKNLVAAGLAKKCEIQVAYAIGVDEPVSINIDTYGTGAVSQAKLEGILKSHEIFDFRPAEIINNLDLLNPQGWSYQDTAAYGHFGRDLFPVGKNRQDRDIAARSRNAKRRLKSLNSVHRLMRDKGTLMSKTIAETKEMGTNYKVKDIGLADFGRQEIMIAEKEMPGSYGHQK